MIKASRKLNIQDYSGKGKDMEMLVNWNSVVQDCRYVKFKIGNEECVVKKEQFIYLAFLLGNEREQDQIVNPLLTNVSNRKTMVSIKATRKIEPGEFINIPITISTNPKTGEVQLK